MIKPKMLFLQVSQWYDLVVFTASMEVCALGWASTFAVSTCSYDGSSSWNRKVFNQGFFFQNKMLQFIQLYLHFVPWISVSKMFSFRLHDQSDTHAIKG